MDDKKSPYDLNNAGFSNRCTCKDKKSAYDLNYAGHYVCPCKKKKNGKKKNT